MTFEPGSLPVAASALDARLIIVALVLLYSLLFAVVYAGTIRRRSAYEIDKISRFMGAIYVGTLTLALFLANYAGADMTLAVGILSALATGMLMHRSTGADERPPADETKGEPTP